MRARWPGIAPSTFPDSGEISSRRRNQARSCRNHPKRGSAKSPCGPIWMIRHPINSGSSRDEPIRLSFGQSSCRHHHVWRHRSDRHGCSGTPPAQKACREALRGPFAITTLRLCRNAGGSHCNGPRGTAHAGSDPSNLGDGKGLNEQEATEAEALPARGVEPDKIPQRSGKSANARPCQLSVDGASNRLPGLDAVRGTHLQETAVSKLPSPALVLPGFSPIPHQSLSH